MFANSLHLRSSSQANHLTMDIPGGSADQVVANLATRLAFIEATFSLQPHVLTINGLGLKDPTDRYSTVHVYTFHSRDENLHFYRQSLGVVKDACRSEDTIAPELDGLIRRSVYRGSNPIQQRLCSMHDTLSEWSTEEMELRTPAATYLSHVVMVPKKAVSVPQLVVEAYRIGDRISQSIFGTPGCFCVTYNAPEIRSVPEKQHVHVDFFRTREDRREQFRRALERY